MSNQPKVHQTTRVGPLQRAAQAATKQLATLRAVSIEYERKRRELEIKHARERAALTAWEVECWHYLREGNSDV